MTPLPNPFLKKIAKAIQDEEVDVYTLSLFCMNADDLSFFNEADREEVRRIFKILIEDTRIHSDLLKAVLATEEKP